MLVPRQRLLSHNLSTVAVLALVLEPLSVTLLAFFALIQVCPSLLVVLGPGREASPSAVLTGWNGQEVWGVECCVQPAPGPSSFLCVRTLLFLDFDTEGSDLVHSSVFSDTWRFEPRILRRKGD